ncbi:MAG: reverse transcriptase, partial [Candidatus Thiodiazotropha endolucinida]|nr:reverse transcriptase [Candidatus Thiodiazotropha taylori]MCW4345453.1 reverse transcriptase [Candidatus Thiodiazotropha endolucinida]
EVRRTTVVPPQSGIWLPIDIPGSENLTEHGFIEPIFSQKTTDALSMIPGVLDLSEKIVSVVNCSEEPITLHAKQLIGTCESYTDSEPNGGVNLVQETLQLETGEPANPQLPDHLQDLFARSSIHLNCEQKEALSKLLLDYHQIFAKSSNDLGLTTLVQHRINVGCAVPVRQPVRRQPLGKRDAERAEIEQMLKRGIIEPSSSPWSSNVVLVSKKDGGLRFCVDYRVLNSLTKKDAYPLPPVAECLDALAGSKWYSTMDLNSGFWQVGLERSSRECSAFSTSLGLFHFTVMPFGLANSPSTFHRLMETVFRTLQWRELLIYMDDILSMSCSFDEGIERLGRIFERLRAANLKLKPSKCLFFQKETKFLGHIVSSKGVATDPEKVSSILDWPPCRTAKQCRSFLGLASYYRQFCPGFAEVARPLHKLCEKGAKFIWDSLAQAAFDNLKKLLFILDTDASAFSVGVVLSQVQNGHERVIAYMSKSINQHEQRYCTTRKELLAVIMSLKTFHSYLYGQEILLRTDNMAVKWLRSLRAPTGQTFRWLQQLETYNITTEHRSGKSHVTADALSRKPCKVCQRQDSLNATDDALNSEGTLPDEYACCTSVEPPELQPLHEVTRVTTRSEQASAEAQLKVGQEVLDGWDPTNIRASQMSDGDIAVLLVAMESGAERPSWNKVFPGTSSLKTL